MVWTLSHDNITSGSWSDDLVANIASKDHIGLGDIAEFLPDPIRNKIGQKEEKS